MKKEGSLSVAETNEIDMQEPEVYSAKKLDSIIKKSTELMKNFKIYIAALISDSKKQFARVDKEEYERVKQEKFVGSKREQAFFDSLSDDKKFVDVKTLVVTKDNIGLGFYPLVWKVLSLEQKIALCRLARLKNENKDFTKFVQDDFDGVISGETGALNISTLSRKDMIGPNFLIEILNASNKIKNMHYLSILERDKDYDKKITAYKTFEELRYSYRIEPADWDIASNKVKALYYDNIFERGRREAEQCAFDMISNDAAGLEGMFPEYDEYVTRSQGEIDKKNLLVIQELGASKMDRDEEYLKGVVKIIRNDEAIEFNKKVVLYKEKLKQIHNADKHSEKVKLEIEARKLLKEIQKEKSERTTFEQAKRHFASHFKEKSQNRHSKTKASTKNNVSEEYEKMN